MSQIPQTILLGRQAMNSICIKCSKQINLWLTINLFKKLIPLSKKDMKTLMAREGKDMKTIHRRNKNKK